LKPVPVASSFDEAAGLLRVCGLSVSYAGSGPSPVMALRQLDLEIAAGEVLGVLGESGCGKSTLALSILGLLPADARIEGSILFRNEELLGLPERQLRRIRGAKISLIHQEPGFALSPVMRVGDQIAEVIIAHRSLTRKARKQEVESMLREVQLADTGRIYAAYPHQLSGGELHRVAIAQALACRPDLIIADEPTRSLDVTVQAEILGVLRNLNQTVGTTLIFITHNPALLAGFADRGSEDVLEYCEKEKMGFIPWFPLAAGRVSSSESPISRIAARWKASPSQLALAWLLARSPVILPIPGTSRVEHLEENVAAAELKVDVNKWQELDRMARAS